MSKVIEVVVIGAVGSGKSHVLSLIDKALRDGYGPHTQIVSRELSMERGLGNPGAQPSADTIFSLKERGLISGQITTNLKVEVDTAEIDAAITKTEALQGFATSFAIDPLEQAIESTARILRDERDHMAQISQPLGVDIPASTIYQRLGAHLEQLLDAQFRRVTA
jgi:energy-coupling factor transporter ATP-binding protein EcfA2